jgi:hypothetical protein
MSMRNFRLSSRCKRYLRSSGMLLSVALQFVICVWGQHIVPIVKAEAVQEEWVSRTAWPLKMGPDGLSRNVGN